MLGRPLTSASATTGKYPQPHAIIAKAALVSKLGAAFGIFVCALPRVPIVAGPRGAGKVGAGGAGEKPVAVGDSDTEADRDTEYCLEPGNAMTSEDDTRKVGGDQT